MVEEILECNFSNPVNSDGVFPETGEIWNFASSTCSKNIDHLALIQENDAGFYLDKTISYGDFFVVFFLLLFLCWGIFKIIWDFIFPKFFKILTPREL